MKRIWHCGLRTVLVLAACLCAVAPPAAAQLNGTIRGQVLDVEGKPWVGLVIVAVSDQGRKKEVKTNKDGNFEIHQLLRGDYDLNIMIPNQEKPYTERLILNEDKEVVVNLNFKEIVAKMGGPAAEEIQKAKAEEQKFTSMKKAFEAGAAQLDHAIALKSALPKTPAGEQDKVKQEIADSAKEAISDFEIAQKSAAEKDPNMGLITARLADAYDLAGRTDDAIHTYQQAIDLQTLAKKPTADFYLNLGNLQARTGKLDDAKASYMKAAELDPTIAAKAWRNFGFVLYNANRLSDAVEPLQKAVGLDPNNQQAWYCLGASLLNNMKTKTVGDTMQVELAPGTVEAYQKALELDPNDAFGQQAKQALDAIEQMAPGVQTRYGGAKKKKS